MSRVARDERSKYQLTLGELTEQLQQLVDAGNGDELLAARDPEGDIHWLGNLMSYRGYYSDLAFEPVGCSVLGFQRLVETAVQEDVYEFPDGVETRLAKNPDDPVAHSVESKGDPRLASKVWRVLERCKLANGEQFYGYKGGEYLMGPDTPLWLAKYGEAFTLALMPTPLARDYPHVYVLNTIRPDGDLE